MAAPSNPTLSELVAEGLSQAGESSPSTALTARAEGNWMSEIKNDIWRKTRKLRSLQVTAHAVIQKGQRRFSYPTDYASDISLTLLHGGETGTATAGSTSSITLAADEDVTEGSAIGKDILVTSGTGQGSLSVVTAYDTSTKIISVTPDFQTAPTSGSGYMIIDQEFPLDQIPINQFQLYRSVSLKRPAAYFPMGDEDYGEFIFETAPDQIYGARLRYYGNIMKLDTAGTLMSSLYSEWRGVWIQGIKSRKLIDEDDTRANDEYLKYQKELQTLVNNQIYGKDLSGLRDHAMDYA